MSIGLRIDATGCSAGELIVRLETLTTPDGGKTSLVPYNITRYASIFLYSPSSATYSAALRTSSTRAIDNNTDVTVITDIQFSSNLTMREQYTRQHNLLQLRRRRQERDRQHVDNLARRTLRPCRRMSC